MVVKGAMGNTVQTKIEADGSYNVDVSSLTAPYRLRAEGTVGGKTYRLHSYAEQADEEGTVNITPFTDLIVANAAQQIAETYFDDDVLDTTETITTAELEAQETALQNRLQDVFDVLGVGTAIDLLNDSFSADHSGLDAALDLISIEVDTNSNVATITNLVDKSTVQDNLLDADDNTDAFSVNSADQQSYTGIVSDTQEIVNKLESLASAFASGLPQSSTIESLFASDFLQSDKSRSQFLTEITTDPKTQGVKFAGVTVSNLDSVNGTADITFNIVLNGQINPLSETWAARKDANLGWQIMGNQYIVDIDELSFHCNDNDVNDSFPGACGINTRFRDNDSTNNGTSGAFIASGTVELIDGTSNQVESTIYLGTANNVANGEMQVYDEGSASYSGDWKAFGTNTGEINPALFNAGDTIRYTLYTASLDISNSNMPAIPVNAQAIASYQAKLAFAPSTTALYPSATQATINAMNSFAPNSNLDISWTLSGGTHSDEVLVQISDDKGNNIEVRNVSFAANVTSTTISASEFSSLDSSASSYDLLVRIYAADDTTGQEHSRDYRATISAGGNGGGSGTGSGLTCGHESGWDNTAIGGMGAPINPNSYSEYQDVVTDCGSITLTAANDVVGTYTNNDGETVVFNNSQGAGTANDPKTGTLDDGSMIISFNWWIDSNGYLVLYTDSTLDSDLPSGFSLREIYALKTMVGSTLSFTVYSEASNYGDMVTNTGSDGEIWYQTYLKQ